jgi:hypothetical protein
VFARAHYRADGGYQRCDREDRVFGASERLRDPLHGQVQIIGILRVLVGVTGCVIDLQEKLVRATGREVDVVRLADAEADPLFLAIYHAETRELEEGFEPPTPDCERPAGA